MSHIGRYCCKRSVLLDILIFRFDVTRSRISTVVYSIGDTTEQNVNIAVYTYTQRYVLHCLFLLQREFILTKIWLELRLIIFRNAYTDVHSKKFARVSVYCAIGEIYLKSVILMSH